MIRYIAVVVAAIAVAAGALFVLRPRAEVPVAVNVEQPAAPVTEAAPRPSQPDAELLAEVERLRVENAALTQQVSELQATLAEARPVSLELPDQWLQSFGAEADPIESVPPQQGEDEASREQRREEWRAQRQEFATQMQTRMTDFLAQQYDSAPDIETRQRMSDISANLNAMMELRGLMEAAATDEERDKLREELRRTQDTTRALMREQQQEVMANAAASLGLTTEEERQAYEESLRQVMQSPFTWGAMMGGGFNRGGGRPGRNREADNDGQP